MITCANAYGYSSVMVSAKCGTCPGGSRAWSRANAPPVRARVGWPPGRLTTPMSEWNTPLAKPVPRAFAHASFAAKRLASVAACLKYVVETTHDLDRFYVGRVLLLKLVLLVPCDEGKVVDILVEISQGKFDGRDAAVVEERKI